MLNAQSWTNMIGGVKVYDVTVVSQWNLRSTVCSCVPESWGIRVLLPSIKWVGTSRMEVWQSASKDEVLCPALLPVGRQVRSGRTSHLFHSHQGTLPWCRGYCVYWEQRLEIENAEFRMSFLSLAAISQRSVIQNVSAWKHPRVDACEIPKLET